WAGNGPSPRRTATGWSVTSRVNTRTRRTAARAATTRSVPVYPTSSPGPPMSPERGNNADTGIADVGVPTADAGHNGVMAESSESSTPPLVLLHAFPLDARMWDPVRERLAARIRVITPDLRGFGRTELPVSDRSPDLADAAADVLAMLDSLGLQRVVLGGCSMGGYVAMAV